MFVFPFQVWYICLCVCVCLLYVCFSPSPSWRLSRENSHQRIPGVRTLLISLGNYFKLHHSSSLKVLVFVSIYHFETYFNIKLNFKILIFVISVHSENIFKYHSSLTMILLSKSSNQGRTRFLDFHGFLLNHTFYRWLDS